MQKKKRPEPQRRKKCACGRRIVWQSGRWVAEHDNSTCPVSADGRHRPR